MSIFNYNPLIKMKVFAVTCIVVQTIALLIVMLFTTKRIDY